MTTVPGNGIRKWTVHLIDYGVRSVYIYIMWNSENTVQGSFFEGTKTRNGDRILL